MMAPAQLHDLVETYHREIYPCLQMILESAGVTIDLFVNVAGCVGDCPQSRISRDGFWNGRVVRSSDDIAQLF